VHVCLRDRRGAVRPGAGRIEPGRAPESRGLADRPCRRRAVCRRAADCGSRMTLSLGFSPCPNDCFMFDAIVHRRIDLEGLDFTVLMEDVETLNRAAFAGSIDVTKVSCHAYAYCADRFALLDAGGALGRGCGPLLISKRPIDA